MLRILKYLCMINMCDSYIKNYMFLVILIFFFTRKNDKPKSFLLALISLSQYWKTQYCPSLLLPYLDRQSVGHDAVHCVFSEGVKVFVRPPHELRLQSVATASVVLKHKEVELHGQIWSTRRSSLERRRRTKSDCDCRLPHETPHTLAYGLVVERHQLAAGVPEELRHEVGWVDSGAFRVDTTQLGFVISGSRRVKDKCFGAETSFHMICKRNMKKIHLHDLNLPLKKWFWQNRHLKWCTLVIC